jgi:hypothetical protein
MAKQQYQHLKDVWNPDISSKNKEEVEFVLKGKNKAGTPVRVTVVLDKCHLPRLVQQIHDIAKNDAEVAANFLERIRKCAQ